MDYLKIQEGMVVMRQKEFSQILGVTDACVKRAAKFGQKFYISTKHPEPSTDTVEA